MNVWYIALWVYMVAGEAILLAIAFDICRKQVKKAPQSGEKRTRKAKKQVSRKARRQNGNKEKAHRGS